MAVAIEICTINSAQSALLVEYFDFKSGDNFFSFETFSKLKLHFAHTRNQVIRHWTMSTPAPGLYIMNKEQKVALKETMDILDNLKQEYDEKERELRFGGNIPKPSLVDHVQPLVFRLNESKHMCEVVDDGPKPPLYILNIQ
ncbi:hypothetical protein BDA99DRAFT_542486 [Phascolomyces articulosus]|uniref:Uncharacterized protein n=1 Tax=Phascolomyces articulosus TaxID=60185 RepID=A0AAD5K0K6_9FUNG|nr:hypothetical protein BDA99DRAFT_542486 [Phascolomyces articulosus]